MLPTSLNSNAPSAVSLGGFVQPDETVTAAGGFIVQVMPAASEETIAQLEANVARAKPVSQLVREGATPQEIIAHVLDGFGVSFVGATPVRFSCRCSRERVLSTLQAMDNLTCKRCGGRGKAGDPRIL
jgi:molecular chaperone Hsp33